MTRTLVFETLKGRRMLKEAQGVSGCPSCGQEVVSKSYTLDSRLEEIEYANGRVDRFENLDSRGNAQTLIEAWGDPEQRTIERSYHPFLNTPLSETTVSVLGAGYKVALWDFDHDGNSLPNENPGSLPGRRIEQGFTKDMEGNLVFYEHITSYTYNEKGQIASIDGPRPGDEDKITFTYYSNGDLQAITQPLVGKTVFSQYDSAGRVGRIQDPNGRFTTLAYDARGRIRSCSTETSSGPVAYFYLYNRAGDLRRVVNPEGMITNMAYEGVYGRLVSITDPMAQGMRFHYDGEGNRDEVKLLEPSTQTPTFWMRYDFQHPDLPGKLWRAVNPDGSFTEYDYEEGGQVSSIKDANGRKTFYGYDVLNRLSTVTQSGNMLTAYDYDCQGNLVRVTDPKSQTTQYTYDDLGRILAVHSPDAGTTTYAYDQAGNLTSRRDAKGVRTVYEYDALNRLTAVHYPRPSQDLLLTYDQGVNGKGRLTSVQDSSGLTTYQYDEVGRLILETRTMGAISFSTSYTHDLNGDTRSITYPSGLKVEYERNAAGRIVASKANGAPLTGAATYSPFGPLRSLTYGQSALPLGRTYDQRYLLSEMSVAEVLTSRYGRYPNGEVKRIQGLREPVVGSASSRYGYLGNRLVVIAGSQQAAYTYDRNGNVVSNATLSFDYDEENRIIRVYKDGAVIARYAYDGQGRRVKKVVGNKSLYYHYDLYGNLIEESGPGGAALRDYIYQEGERIAMQSYDSNPGTYFFLNDHLGAPRKLIDPSGLTVWEGAYLPFGEVQIPIRKIGNPFRFPGQYFDAETGLHYNYHRYYDPKTGRYLTPDPIGLWGGVNLFAYTINNPVNLIDPLGLWLAPGHRDLTARAMTATNAFTSASITMAVTANIDVDRPSNWFNNPDHYMPGTQAAAEEVIRNQLNSAIALENAGYHDEAMDLLGRGLHTVQDRYAHFEQNASNWRHITGRGECDDATKHPREFEAARAATERYINQFLQGIGRR
jgi:RHS repeat-associated protein